MASSSSSSDDSSSDNDERKKRLKDASNHEFADISQKSESNGKHKRPKVLEKGNHSNTYEDHVASKLCAVLDEKIKYTDKKPNTVANDSVSSDIGGVKLFGSSKCLINETSQTLESVDNVKKPKIKRRKIDGNSNDDDEDDPKRFQSVAVSADWVLKQSKKKS